MSDHAAFPEDLTRHAEALRRVALAVVRSEEAADDVVQSAYVKALEDPGGPRTFGWMARAVRHRAIDALRRGRARREHEATHVRPAPLADASEIVERIETFRILSDTIAQLPAGYQQVIYLRYMEGLAPTGIAHRIGAPVKTVKTRLARALARMRELLERRLGGGREGLPALLLLPLGLPNGLPQAAAPTAAAATGGLLPHGIALMSKKLVLVCAVLVLLAAYKVFSPGDADPVQGIGVATPLVEPGEADLDAGPDLVSSEPEDAGRSSVPVLEVAPSSAAETQPELGSLLVRVKRASGTPVAGVEVYVQRDPRADTWDGIGRVRTDDVGEARLDAVAPSTVSVGPLREYYGNKQEVTIEAGEQAVVELTVPDGITVRGRVLDDLDRPVGGAEIWVATGMQFWLGGEIVGRSDRFGEFEFDGIDPGTGLGAIAPGFERSSVIDLDAVVQDGDTARIELRLVTRSGAVTGRVVDPEGLPVEGAWVAVGKPIRYFNYHGLGEGLMEQWTPMVARTAVDGTFVIHGLPVGAHPAEVKAEGFALWKADIEVTESSPAQVQIQLDRGFSVVGTVRDAKGEALAGAIVRAYDTELDRSFIQGGQFDYYSAFGFGKTKTDAHGNYRIDHLQLVPIHMWATPSSMGRNHGEALMRDNGVVEGREGEVVRWDATLSEGLVLYGRVTYSDDEPMGDVFVTARHEDSGTTYTNVANAEGEFRFTNMDEGAHALGVQLWFPPEGAAPVEATGVFPGPDPVLLTADFPKPVDREPGRVTGRIVDESQRLADLSQLRVILRWKSRFVWNESATYDGTRFTFDEIDPGEYRVCAFSGTTQIFQGEWFELLPAETKDLGDLRTAPGGTILLTVDRSAVPEQVRPVYSTGRKDAIDWDEFEVGKAMPVRLENLEPGVHRIAARGDGIARIEEELEVEAGAELAVTLVLRPAVRRDFSVDWPAGEKLGYLRTWIHESDGTAIWDLKETNAGALPRPYERWTRLPIGDFTLKAETGSGLAGTIEFSVTDLTAEQDAVRLILR